MSKQLPQRQKPRGGLHITITFHELGVTLTLAREATYPSEEEWHTFIKNFPYFIPPQTSVKFIDGNEGFTL